MAYFPSSPTVGQTYSFSNILYTWDGTAWIPAVTTGSIPYITDLRDYGAPGGGGDATSAMFAAIEAGHNTLFLPAGYYIQGGTYENGFWVTKIPAHVHLICENISAANPTAIIKAYDRTQSDARGFIYLGPGAKITDGATQSYPGDTQNSPVGNIQKTVYQPWVDNASDVEVTWVPWVGLRLIRVGATVTSPGDVVSTDNPGIAITTNSDDGIYLSHDGNGGDAMRIEIYGNNNIGLLIGSGMGGSQANQHAGILINEYGTNANSASIAFIRNNNSTTPLISYTDVGPTTYSTSIQQYTMSYISGGSLFTVYQTTTPYSGDFTYINAGNYGGTFTGNFVNYTIANASKFRVDSSGSIIANGAITIPLSAPASNTATGTAGTIKWDANYIYVCTATNHWKRAALSDYSAG